MEKSHILQRDEQFQKYEKWIVEAYKNAFYDAYNSTLADVSKLPE